MIKIPVHSVWDSVVDSYYEISRPLSILEWVKQEYSVEREWIGQGSPFDDGNYWFIFNNDSDATAFRLKFAKTK